MNNLEFFHSQRISSAITRISDLTGGLIYLIEGTDKALLVDTGVGMGDLREYVSKLTTLPVEVILTHGHMDHTAGIAQFDHAYLNKNDWELYTNHNNVALRSDYIKMIRPDIQLDEKDIIPIVPYHFLPLTDGQCFELGGITVRMIDMPGHTQGSMAVLIEEERAIIFGDACNLFTFLFAAESSSISQYLHTLKAFKEHHETSYDTVYLSHGDGDVDRSVLEGVIAICEELLAGKSDATPFDFMGELQCIAKCINPVTRMRADGAIGNIVYNPNRVG